MEEKTVRYRITGTAPLLMSNVQMANPLNEFAQAIRKISSKRKKTISDHKELARLEFMGRLYLGKNRKPVIPGYMIESMLAEAAKKEKLGKVFKAVVFCDGVFLLEYDGPTDPDKLWKIDSYQLTSAVGIRGAKVMRTRPQFPEWSLEFPITYIDGEVEPDAIDRAIERAGIIVGLGDWRPKYGRFKVEKK